MQGQPAPYELLVQAFQPLDVDLADPHLRPRVHMETHVQHRIGVVLIGDGRIHLGESIAVLLQRREQPGAGGQYLGCHRGSAALEDECPLLGGRNLPVEGDAAQVIQRPQLETDGHFRVRALRQRIQRIGKAHAVERHSVDLDGDGRLIVAVALDHRFQPVRLAARTRDQTEGTDRGRPAQRYQFGGRTQRAIHRAIAGRCDVDPVGLTSGAVHESAAPLDGLVYTR